MLKVEFIIFSICLGLLLVCTFEEIDSFKEDFLNQESIQSYYDEENQEESYLGILEIPSIHLKQGFYSHESPLNQVSQNIQFISGCDPAQTCDFILASHSGDSSISYFKNLHLLKLHDKAILDYQHKIYSYQLVQILNEPKDGTISLEKVEFPRLILTTCDRQNNTVQKVFIFEKEEA